MIVRLIENALGALRDWQDLRLQLLCLGEPLRWYETREQMRRRIWRLSGGGQRPWN